MAQLAIKGHKTRGNEVIEILEMLGGRNDNYCCGKFINRIYFINENGYIEQCDRMHHLDYFQLSLEEFLEKFPYKIGDKVQHKGATSCGSVFEIEKVRWEDEEVKYDVCDLYWKNCKSTATAEDLQLYQPYKEETKEKTMEEMDEKAVNHVFSTEVISFDIAQRDKYELDLQGKFIVVLREGKYYVERIKPQYPKTYEECHELMVQWLGCDCNPNSELILCDVPIHDFCKLIVARNIYWKIAGEQMGLGKPWEPAIQDTIWGITRSKDEVEKYSCRYGRTRLLEFPTAEMRDAFYENFKDLIEQCKEVL